MRQRNLAKGHQPASKAAAGTGTPPHRRRFASLHLRQISFLRYAARCTKRGKVLKHEPSWLAMLLSRYGTAAAALKYMTMQ